MTSLAMQRAIARQKGANPAPKPSFSTNTEKWPCACAFAKSCNESSPYAFPRVGLYDTVIMRGGFIIKHKGSGREAYEPKVKDCCHRWFEPNS